MCNFAFLDTFLYILCIILHILLWLFLGSSNWRWNTCGATGIIAEVKDDDELMMYRVYFANWVPCAWQKYLSQRAKNLQSWSQHYYPTILFHKDIYLCRKKKKNENHPIINNTNNYNSSMAWASPQTKIGWSGKMEAEKRSLFFLSFFSFCVVKIVLKANILLNWRR